MLNWDFNENTGKTETWSKWNKEVRRAVRRRSGLCRYRYDVATRKQYKTVEIIVSESDWTPPPAKYPESTLVPLKIGIKETVAQEQVKAVGGRWDMEKKLWFVPYGCIAGTKLEMFIAVETLQKDQKQ